jgi:hypothetical protein
MTTISISPLRQRMIEDMTARKLVVVPAVSLVRPLKNAADRCLL